jgi:DNA-binding response OmpR family regulator
MACVLIIDDDVQMRAMLRKVLDRAGHQTSEASDGCEGLREHQRLNFDLIITDILMPEGEGLETIRQLRQVSPAVKIIAISGGGQSGTLDFLDVAERLGADRSLQKPFSLQELLDVIDALLCAS